MAFRKSNVYLSLVNSYIIDSPQPSSISYWWNLGSLLGLCLCIQICTGIFLAMHYSSNIELAFSSVEHIIREVQLGWLLRYMHANGASFFFMCMYAHIGKGLYYGSYKTPRSLVWIIGVIIFILTIATAFLGYCCVYGQMSHWGNNIIALNILIIIILYFKNKYPILLDITKRKNIINYIGPLNIDILSIIYGSILGDGYAEKRKGGKGLRILFQQENIHKEYLIYLHSLVANCGYCNLNIPQIKIRLSKNGKIRYYIKFHTWTYDSFNFIFNDWYIKNPNKINGYIKIVPKSLSYLLTPLALAIWIQDDGCKIGKGLKLATNCFKYEEVQYLTLLLHSKYNIKSSIQKGNIENLQFIIYIWAESIPLLANIVKPYIVPSIKYKLGLYL